MSSSLESVGFTSIGEQAETSDTQLASALLTLGVQPIHDPQRVVRAGCPDSVVWIFHPQSECGLYDTADLIKKWNDKKWLTDPNNEHPLAYLACQMHNYNSLRRVLRDSVPMGVVQKGSRSALVPLNADEATKNKIFKHL